MKLPAQTSAAGAWVGFIWLWNLGMLRVNTHMYIKKKNTSPLIIAPPSAVTPLLVPSYLFK